MGGGVFLSLLLSYILYMLNEALCALIMSFPTEAPFIWENGIIQRTVKQTLSAKPKGVWTGTLASHLKYLFD